MIFTDRQRNSSFELLRIIAIFGIINMHAFGPYLQQATGENLIYALIINGIFNMGVTLFMLISGYFGISRSKRKFLKLYGIVIFYSLFGFALVYIATGAFSLKALVYAIFPISTNKYWYITSYLLIFVISPYLNKILEDMSHKEYIYILTIMCCLFYVAPTFLYVEIMHDGGKGVVNLLIVYMIGKYIRLHGNAWNLGKRRLLCMIFPLLVLGMALNYVCIIYFHHGEWIAPFSRDCSLIILSASILVFILFKQINFYNSLVNKIAMSVFPIYVLEGDLRKIISAYDLLHYQETGFYVDITICVILIMVMIILIDNFRMKILRLSSREKI